MAAPSHPNTSYRARSSRRVIGCTCRLPWPIAIPPCSPIPTLSTRPQAQPARQLRPGAAPLHRFQRGSCGVQDDAHRGAGAHARLPMRPSRSGSLRHGRGHQRNEAPPGNFPPGVRLGPAWTTPSRTGRTSSTSSAWPNQSAGPLVLATIRNLTQHALVAPARLGCPDRERRLRPTLTGSG